MLFIADFPHTFLQNSARHHHLMSAAGTFQTKIRPLTQDLPFMGPAGMLLLQFYDISHMNLHIYLLHLLAHDAVFISVLEIRAGETRIAHQPSVIILIHVYHAHVFFIIFIIIKICTFITIRCCHCTAPSLSFYIRTGPSYRPASSFTQIPKRADHTTIKSTSTASIAQFTPVKTAMYFPILLVSLAA